MKLFNGAIGSRETCEAWVCYCLVKLLKRYRGKEHTVDIEKGLPCDSAIDLMIDQLEFIVTASTDLSSAKEAISDRVRGIHRIFRAQKRFLRRYHESLARQDANR